MALIEVSPGGPETPPDSGRDPIDRLPTIVDGGRVAGTARAPAPKERRRWIHARQAKSRRPAPSPSPVRRRARVAAGRAPRALASGLGRGGAREPDGARQVPRLRGVGPPRRGARLARVDPDRALAGRRRALRRRDGVAPPRADRLTRPTASRCSTTARSTASTSTAAAWSGARWRTATRSSSGATRSASWTPPSVGRAGARGGARRHGRVASGPSRRPLSCARPWPRRSRSCRSRAARARPPPSERSTDVLRRIGLDVLAVDLDPQGNLSDYFDVPPDATPTIADVLRGDAKAKAADARRDRAGLADPRRGGARRCRARWAASSCCARRSRTPRKQPRHHPHRLPAGARPADDQRPGRRRLGADLLRGAVLRAAGRRGRARGHRAGARSSTTPTSSGSASC